MNQRHYEFQTIACVVGMNTIKEGSVSLEIQTGTQKTPPKQKQNKNKPKKKKKNLYNQKIVYLKTFLG